MFSFAIISKEIRQEEIRMQHIVKLLDASKLELITLSRSQSQQKNELMDRLKTANVSTKQIMIDEH